MIDQAIQMAEGQTSAEVRVHLERKSKADILSDAQKTFEHIGMTKTAEKNGVLIFLCLATQRFAVIGDSGIHQKVSPNFWGEVSREMEHCFLEDRFAEGIIASIQKIAEILKAHFPRQAGDVNELPDTISYSL